MQHIRTYVAIKSVQSNNAVLQGELQLLQVCIYSTHSMHRCLFVCMPVYTCTIVCMSVCMYACMYVYVYVFDSVYICLFTFTDMRKSV